MPVQKDFAAIAVLVQQQFAFLLWHSVQRKQSKILTQRIKSNVFLSFQQGPEGVLGSGTPCHPFCLPCGHVSVQGASFGCTAVHCLQVKLKIIEEKDIAVTAKSFLQSQTQIRVGWRIA